LNANKKKRTTMTMEDEIDFYDERTDAEKKRCFEAAILAYMEKEGNRFSRTAAMFKEEAQLGDANEMVVSGGVLEKGWEFLKYEREFDEDDLFDAFAEGDLALVQLHECVRAHVTKGILHGFRPSVGRRGYSFNSRNPLYLAVRRGHFALVRYLVEKGINKDEIVVTSWDTNGEDDGKTALMVAIIYEHVDIAEYLLEQGCDVTLADSDGWTALHHAAHSGQPELVQLLFRFGANLDTVLPVIDVDGRDALDIAIDDGNDAVANIIRVEMRWR